MDIANALQTTIELARQNIVDQLDHPDEHEKQSEAVDIVEDLAVNQYGDDNFETEDNWFDRKKQVLIGDFRLSGSRWIVGSTNEPSPLDDAIFIKHEDAVEPTYMSVTEADLLIAAIRCAQQEIKGMVQCP